MRQAVRGVAVIGGALMLLAGPTAVVSDRTPPGSAPSRAGAYEKNASRHAGTRRRRRQWRRRESGTPCDQGDDDPECLRGRCRAGNATGCARLGRAYANGFGRARGRRASGLLLPKRLRPRLCRGVHQPGFHARSRTRLAADPAQALLNSRLGCERGDPHGCTNVGSMYDNGRGVAKDDAQAAAWYRRGCAGGDGRDASTWASTTRRASACQRIRPRPSRFTAMPPRWVTSAESHASRPHVPGRQRRDARPGRSNRELQRWLRRRRWPRVQQSRRSLRAQARRRQGRRPCRPTMREGLEAKFAKGCTNLAIA